MRVVLTVILIATAGAILGCDGDSETTTVTAEADGASGASGTASPQPLSDQDEIEVLIVAWANAYAEADEKFCELEPPADEGICKQYMADGKTTDYLRGYAGATAEDITLKGNKGRVSLSNGCVVTVQDFGEPAGWRVTNSGGQSLAKGCEQGIG